MRPCLGGKPRLIAFHVLDSVGFEVCLAALFQGVFPISGLDVGGVAMRRGESKLSG